MQKATSGMQMLRPARAGRFGRFAFCMLSLALLGVSAGCANKAGAATVPDGPPLAMPAPPPRVIAPVELVAETPPPVTPEPAPAAPPRTPAARPPAARQEPAAAAPPPVQPVVPTATPAPEPREVRAVPSAAAAAEERKVRDVMSRASRDLNRVDYQKLSAEGQAQYNQSKRFSEQADQAIKDRNYVYAMTLADKAATLAAELAGR
jgi:type IV secretory pathway VirB10-like protein